MKLLIDSSVWIEYFSDGAKAKVLEKYFKGTNKIILPSIVTYEVYKKIKTTMGEQMAVTLLAQMERVSSAMVPVDHALAVKAADLSIHHKIPMADAMIYASALAEEATIVTLDAHFKNLSGVQFMG